MEVGSLPQSNGFRKGSAQVLEKRARVPERSPLQLVDDSKAACCQWAPCRLQPTRAS